MTYPGRSAFTATLVLLFFGASGITTSLMLGQDANWDLQNYHLYNPWALLNGGRFDVDAHPAVEPTFLNPLLHLLAFPVITELEDRVGGAILGFVHGIPGFLVFLLARRIFGTTVRSTALSLLAGVVGATSAMAFSQIGTTFGDLTTSILVLAALILVTRSADAEPQGRPLHSEALAGFLIGIATGLKPTNGVFAVGLLAAVALVAAPRRRAAVAVLSIAATVGAALAYGWWAYILTSRFGNPVFPLANNWFQSPFYPPGALAFPRFFPQTGVEWLFYPFHFGWDHRTAEVAFRDFRLAAAFMGLAALVLGATVRARESMSQPARAALPLCVFVAVSYVVWLLAFSIQRYAVVLELLAALVCFIAISRFTRGVLRDALAGTLAAALLATTIPANWGRVAWEGTTGYAALRNVDDSVRGQAAVLLNTPLASLAPASGFTETSWIGAPFNDLDRSRIERLLAGKRIYALAFPRPEDREQALRTLSDLGLGIVAPCSKFVSKLSGYVLMCEAEKHGRFDAASFVNDVSKIVLTSRAPATEIRMRPDSISWIPFEFSNKGTTALWANLRDTFALVNGLPEGPEVNASYHLLLENGGVAVHDGERTSFPRSLLPGNNAKVWLRVRAPATRGRYVIQPDVVFEHTAWLRAQPDHPQATIIVQ